MEHLTLKKAWQSNGLCQNLSSIFLGTFLERLSVFTGFTKRKGPITGEIFVNSCISMAMEEGWGGSLNQHCMVLKKGFGILVREQSLNERFNKNSESMMRSLFELVLKKHLRLENPMKMLNLFEEVYVEDSTNFELPVLLKNVFKGSGGGASEAGLKIDALYGLRWGTMEVMFHGSAGSDTWQGVPVMKPRSLLLRDLGYFKMEDFATVMANGGFFLSRFKYGVKTYSGPEGKEETNLLLMLNLMRENETKGFDVYIGEKKRLKVRLVLQKVPKPVGDAKRKKLKEDKQNKRKGISEERLAFCDANCYITNIGAQMLGDEEIITLYGLRWIIEILFKAWKSISNLEEKINKMNKHRFMCMLYAHMIKTLLDTKLVQYFRIEYWNLFGFKISELKAFSVLHTFRNLLWDALRSGKHRAIDLVLEQISQTILALAEKRKRGKNENHNDFYIFVKSQT